MAGGSNNGEDFGQHNQGPQNPIGIFIVVLFLIFVGGYLLWNYIIPFVYNLIREIFFSGMIIQII